MLNYNFVHLRVHSEFSIVDSVVRINDLISSAKFDNQSSIALTDFNNLFGLIRFYKKACKEGIKPIVGCDVLIKNNDVDKKSCRLLFLVQNETGYLNLCNLLSKAWIYSEDKKKIEIDSIWLNNKITKGLIVLSGAHNGDIGLSLINGNISLAKLQAKYWSNVFHNRFYIELQRIKRPYLNSYIRKAVVLANDLNLPVVATHPIQFIKPEDFFAHEARVCISDGTIINDINRKQKFSNDQYFLTQKKMIDMFSDIPSAILNTIEISKKCNFFFEKKKVKLPLFPLPKNVSSNKYLIKKSYIGLRNKFIKILDIEEKYNDYFSRLIFECDTIIKMGFSDYFLIVSDFINWAKTHSIPVGPGRGSGAGSLVAFSLGITELDPLRYNLLFERFLNPNRVSMPDFDIDFCQNGRDKVIQYVKNKYGIKSVSQIVTFGTMAARASIRDVGRVLDLGYKFTDGIARLIPFKPGKNITISDSLKEQYLLNERFKNEKEVFNLLNLAKSLEGLVRSVGVHAGGILIVPGKIVDFCPLYVQSNDNNIISQYDKDDLEYVGLVKFDFLSLATLTILKLTEKYINKYNKLSKKFSVASIKINNEDSFDLLKYGNTIAVFQLESYGMQLMLKNAKPDCFEDIIALVALYRPGPIDLINIYCARKSGEENIEYLDFRVKDILKDTYGIMVYQEQVMKIVQVIGGYSLGDSDLLRRIISKKKYKDMNKHRKMFVLGAVKNGLTVELSNKLFDLIEKFAGYGFNKSHAASYALLSYYTAWLKTHYLIEFMSANMSLSMNDSNKLYILIEDCYKNGVFLMLPDINMSNYNFHPVFLGEKKVINYGLGAIKGNRENSINEIMRVREFGKFLSIFDFCNRIDRGIVNKRAIELLICSGSFDSLDDNRARLLESMSFAIRISNQINRSVKQVDFFGMNFISSYFYLNTSVEWTLKEKLKEEKKSLGFHLSDNLFNAYKNELKYIEYTSICDLSVHQGKSIIVGIIKSLYVRNTKNGIVVLFELDDGTDKCNVVVFMKKFNIYRNIIKEDELLIIHGYLRFNTFRNSVQFVAELIMDINYLRIYYAKSIRISINSNFDKFCLLSKILKTYCLKNKRVNSLVPIILSSNVYTRNIKKISLSKLFGLKIEIEYFGNLFKCVLSLSDDWRINPTDRFIKLLNDKIGKNSVNIIYK